MFRTRILEVVCFLGTCFFRAVRAGLQGGERVQVTRGVSRCCLTLTPPPPTPMLVFCSGEGFKELGGEAEMKGEEGSLLREMWTIVIFSKWLWISG